MDLNGIIQAIGSLGFPIAMCVARFWYMIQQNQAHKEEMNALKDAVNELQIAITKLSDKLGGNNNV